MSDFSTNDPGSNGPMPFGPRPEPGPGGQTATTPRFAPQRAEQPQPQPQPQAQPQPQQATPVGGPPAGGPQAEVKGRIHIADEVVEKVAGLAALEVEGVADLGGDFARAIESVRERIGIGNKRGDQGVKAEVKGHEVVVSVTIMVEFGHVVLEVARNVQVNVARKTNRMLGLKVLEVNVTVDDVRTAVADEVDEPVLDGAAAVG